MTIESKLAHKIREYKISIGYAEKEIKKLGKEVEVMKKEKAHLEFALKTIKLWESGKL